MWVVFILDQIIRWNHIDSVWRTILCSHTSFTRRWRYMWNLGISLILLGLGILLGIYTVLYNLFLLMQRPHKAYPVELAQFHSADYVEFLHRITPGTQHLFADELARCMVKKKRTFLPLFLWALHFALHGHMSIYSFPTNVHNKDEYCTYEVQKIQCCSLIWW